MLEGLEQQDEGEFIDRLYKALPAAPSPLEAVPSPDVHDVTDIVASIAVQPSAVGPGRCPGNIEPCANTLRARVVDQLAPLSEGATETAGLGEWSDRKVFCDAAWDLWRRGALQGDDRVRLQNVLRMECR